MPYKSPEAKRAHQRRRYAERRRTDPAYRRRRLDQHYASRRRRAERDGWAAATGAPLPPTPLPPIPESYPYAHDDVIDAIASAAPEHLIDRADFCQEIARRMLEYGDLTSEDYQAALRASWPTAYADIRLDAAPTDETPLSDRLPTTLTCAGCGGPLLYADECAVCGWTRC